MPSCFLNSPWSVGQPDHLPRNAIVFSSHESGGNVNNLKSVVIITKYTSNQKLQQLLGSRFIKTVMFKTEVSSQG